MNMLKFINVFLVLAAALCVNGCSGDNLPEEAPGRPTITFDAPYDVYTVKTGDNLLLSPTVTDAQGASCRWLHSGQTVGTQITYLFTANAPGQYYITFEVTKSGYTVDKEIRIDVTDRMPPVITMGIPEQGFIILTGQTLPLEPGVSGAGDICFEWIVNGSICARTKDYTFLSDRQGEYDVVFVASNEDGEADMEFTVSVRDPENMPFSWEWEKSALSMTLGRSLVIEPLEISNSFDAVYTLHVDGRQVEQSGQCRFVFTPVVAREHLLVVTMRNQYRAVEQNIAVSVTDDEDFYFRPVNDRSRAEADKVWQYLPAPGQFINEYYTASTMEQACVYAEERLASQGYVSLGAFGGYIVVGFDHSIINDGGYNIRILGNSFDGSSEPGVVWVMQDENGDGLPNDTWYELKGSEHGKQETLSNYAVTYYRPSGAGQPVAWTDNRGGSGTVDHLGPYHSQDSYYPLWVEHDSYTLYGTRLQDRTYDKSGTGTYWVNGNFDWGYADNYSTVDRLTNDNNSGADVNANHFMISNAVDAAGNPVELKYVDFVKVQTAVQAKAGWLGEVSTEVFGVTDYNMIKDK